MSLQEEWRPVVGYGGVYSVSNLGRVRRDRDGIRRSRAKAGHIRTHTSLINGYAFIALTKPDCKTKRFLAHRLVLAAFVGPLPAGLEVNHKNGIKTDNRLENLEYVTHSENVLHAFRTGLQVVRRGVAHPCAKLSPEKIDFARRMKAKGETYRSAAFLLNVTPSAICNALYGRAWTA